VIDANVLLALLIREHSYHQRSLAWFLRLEVGEAGICRFVQLSVTRLLGTRTVMGASALPAAHAWWKIAELLDDERVEFREEPIGLADVLPTLFRYRQPTPNLINDAYLAAFAIAGGHKLVTCDRGFTEFRGLALEILGD
jgi:toxin-antitoxin system PIN domain toxin